MLSLFISGVAELKKSISSAVEFMTNILKEYKYVRMVYAPTIDAVTACSILGETLIESNIKVVFSPEYLPPTSVEEPSVYVGLEPTRLKRDNVKKPALFILNDGKRYTPLENIVILNSLSTLSSIASILASEGWFVSDFNKMLVLSVAYLLGYDRGESGDLVGVDKIVASELLSSKSITEEITLKFFDIGSEPLYKSIAKTIDPFIPSVAGNEEKAKELISSLGLSPPEKVFLENLSSEKLEALVKALFTKLREVKKTARPYEIAGKIYKSMITGESFDIRKTGYSLLLFLDKNGYHSLIASILSKTFRHFLVQWYDNVYESVIECVDEIVSMEPKIVDIPGLQLPVKAVSTTCPAAREYPITLDHVLRKMGLLGKNVLLMYEDSSELRTPIATAFQALSSKDLELLISHPNVSVDNDLVIHIKKSTGG